MLDNMLREPEAPTPPLPAACGHPLHHPHVNVGLSWLAPLSVGLALMGMAPLTWLFWVGFAIAILGSGVTTWLSWKEIREKTIASWFLIAFIVSELGLPCFVTA